MATDSHNQHRGFRILIGLLILIGVVGRILPLVNHQGRLLSQFPTEDGYLMLQIGRNMSLGHGMSVSAGTIATNGTQPFCTFIWSLGYRLVDGDRVQGVALVLIWQTLVAIASAWLVVRIGRLVFADQDRSTMVSYVAAACWFSSTVSIPHTMNCLESGTYVCAVLASVWLFLHYLVQFGSNWPIRSNLLLGVMLGWTFWVRNDAVFLVLAVCLTKLYVGREKVTLAFYEACQIGVTTIVIALPWLYNNYTRFGGLMPISGHSQSYAAPFGYGAHLLPPVLVEYLSTFLPIPQRWMERSEILWSTSIILAIAIWILIRTFRSTHQKIIRAAIVLVAIYAAGLCGYYGTATAARHFIGRYLFPLSPFASLFGFAVLFELFYVRIRPLSDKRFLFAASSLMVLTIIGLHARMYILGRDHQHFPVVEWVKNNVEAESWVGAIQSGTLGYFHDRTYNLDGKVSPEALQAKQLGRIPQYVIEKDIRHLVDWYGISEWIEVHPEIKEHFRIEIADRERNLAALTRITDSTPPKL